MKQSLEEIFLGLNLDSVKPSFGRVVTSSCLRALLILLKKGHLPATPEVFWNYAKAGIYQRVGSLFALELFYSFINFQTRFVAIDCLVDFASFFKRRDVFEDLLQLLVRVKDPGVRFHLVKALTLRPPFTVRTGSGHPLDSPDLLEMLWKKLLDSPSDSRTHCGLIDLYAVMYGAKEKPMCLREPTLEASLSPAPPPTTTASTVMLLTPTTSSTPAITLPPDFLELTSAMASQPSDTPSASVVNAPVEDPPDELISVGPTSSSAGVAQLFSWFLMWLLLSFFVQPADGMFWLNDDCEMENDRSSLRPYLGTKNITATGLPCVDWANVNVGKLKLDLGIKDDFILPDKTGTTCTSACGQTW